MLIPEDQIWMVVVGFIIAFVLAFGIGANDVANTFGSSVGSGVLTLRQACTLATICEMSGAILLGSKVSSTIRKGIVDTSQFDTLENGPATLMAGQVAALCGACIWLLIATFFRLPVSGTHSIVGATIGFSLVLFGVKAINWMGVLKIVSSWFLSPLLSGLVSVGLFVLIHYLVLLKEDPLEPALRLLPGFYGTMVAVNIVSIILGGSEVFQFHKVPIYGVFILGCGGGTITVLCIKLFMLPYLRKRIIAGDNAGPGILDKMYIACGCHRLEMFCRKCRRKRKGKPDNDVVVETPLDLAPKTNDLRDNAGVPEVAFGSNRISNTPHVRPHGDTANRLADGQTTADQEGTNPPPIVRSAGTHRVVSRTFEVEPVEQVNMQTQPNGNQFNAYLTSMPADSTDHMLSITKRGVLAQPSLPAIGEEDSEGREPVKDRPTEARVFWLLQILTSVFGSFAHGGNDVSNAIGPLMGLWIIGVTQDVNSKMANPYWILVYGGIGISIGLWVWGRRVIQTLGEDLTVITPSSGVCIELGSALTVLLASKFGLPVSTTHCQVGSVIAVGRFRSRDNVDWRIFRNIIIAWVVTVPMACGISALIMFLLRFAL
ncbi:hypothetical protein CRM22_009512 [Opisthorchis felineus]|uniref:Phosphate transporter n=1 Tax=Opisthorchis felineus TaxID=147828 RepID=A0A4S2LDK9_OPIFE|nr:hypothetical protein CRM22_009512 [Opisthorchis felineus]